MCGTGVRDVRVQVRHAGGAGAPPLGGGRRAHHAAAVPRAQAEQADRVPAGAARPLGDRPHRHRDEAQAGRRPVRGRVRGRLEAREHHRQYTLSVLHYIIRCA